MSKRDIACIIMILSIIASGVSMTFSLVDLGVSFTVISFISLIYWASGD